MLLCLAHLVGLCVQLPQELGGEMKKYDADKHGTSLLAAAWSLHRMLGRRQKACDENTDEKTEGM